MKCKCYSSLFRDKEINPISENKKLNNKLVEEGISMNANYYFFLNKICQ